ncbi:MAG: hypothetical protein ACJ74J_07485 [Blastocatellia bacterium]
MERLAVQVECYAGSRADERPRRILIEGRQHTVARLLSSSIEQSLKTTAMLRRFRVITDAGLQLDLIRTADGDWFLERKTEIKTTDEHR